MTPLPLGDVKKSFKPGLDNLIAGIIIGCLMIIGGGTLIYFAVKDLINHHGSIPFWADRGPSWGFNIPFAAVGAGFAIGGYFLIRTMRSLLSLRVQLCTGGFSVTEKDVTRLFAWPEILSVEEIHLYQRAPVKGIAKYALLETMNRSFIVKAKDGNQFEFTVTSIKGHTELADLIKQETDRRNVPWSIVEKHM